MIHAVNYCKCGRMMENLQVIVKQTDKKSAGLVKEICPHCLHLELSKPDCTFLLSK